MCGGGLQMCAHIASIFDDTSINGTQCSHTICRIHSSRLSFINFTSPLSVEAVFIAIVNETV